MNLTEKSAEKGQNWIFWLIVAVGALPMVAAWYFYSHPDLLTKRGNQGNLITPPIPVNYDVFKPSSLQGVSPLKQIKGRWVMIHVIPGDCDRACKENIANTRKLLLLFSKDLFRVKRLAVWSRDVDLSKQIKQMLAKDETLYLAQVPSSFLKQLEKEVIHTPLRGDQLILMDPLGNLMMWYDSGFDPYGVYRDMRRLLRASRIG